MTRPQAEALRQLEAAGFRLTHYGDHLTATWKDTTGQPRKRLHIDRAGAVRSTAPRPEFTPLAKL